MSRQLARYKLHKLLGKGGMAEVWLGSRVLGSGARQTVAIKRLRADRMNDPFLVELMEAEARVCMELCHENLVRVYDFDVIEDRPCVIMEYVEGITLGKFLTHRLPYPEILRLVLVHALAGLEHAHERGVLHRDISPNNIMITEDGVVKLVDFGVSKSEDSWVRATPHLAGTPPYMPLEALEALDGRDVTRGSDIYSLGATLYEALEGTPPYGRESRTLIQERMMTRPQPRLPRTVPDDLRVFIDFSLGPFEARTDRAVDRAIAAFRRDVGEMLTAEELGREIEFITNEITLEEEAENEPRVDTPGPALVPGAHLAKNPGLVDTEALEEPCASRADDEAGDAGHATAPRKRDFWLVAAMAFGLICGLAVNAEKRGQPEGASHGSHASESESRTVDSESRAPDGPRHTSQFIEREPVRSRVIPKPVPAPTPRPRWSAPPSSAPAPAANQPADLAGDAWFGGFRVPTAILQDPS